MKEKIALEKEKCLRNTFMFINNLSKCGLNTKKDTVRIKLFDNSIKLHNHNGNWWYNVDCYEMRWLFDEEQCKVGNTININWFCRCKSVSFNKIEEVWFNNKPLYINGKGSLGCNLYLAIFKLPFAFCQKNNIEYWGNDTKRYIYEKRSFLRTQI